MFTILKKIKNSFLIPRMHNFFIRNKDYDLVLNDRYQETFLKKILLKIFYFYPRLREENQWAQGDSGKYRDYHNFKNLRDFVDTYTLEKIMELTTNYDDPILDLGCNQGRYLKYLFNNGYNNLYGVDVMKTAIDYLKKNSYYVYKNSNISVDFFQRYLGKFKDNFFSNTFTIGATIELIHPSYDLIKEMVRVTNKNIILLISENGHWYPRFYIYEFKRNKVKLKYYKKFKKENLSLIVFEK